MSQQSQAGDPLAVFGANRWLADEQRERYLADPESVAPEWRRLFTSAPLPGTSAAGNGTAKGRARVTADEPSAAGNGTADGQATVTAHEPSGAGNGTADGRATATAGEPSANGSSNGSAGHATMTAPRPAPAAAPAPPAPRQAPSSEPSRAPAPGGGARPTASPAPPAPPRPAPAPEAPAPGGEDTTVRLRGSAARVVENMEQSLAVPTATSVRTVPAKLLMDNRIVLNNHLRRRRGGKVSFTHIIGFALVEALRELPAMNHHYTEVDGRPGLVRPAGINVGIAIDVEKDDGTRQLLVPNVKDAGALDFAGWHAAYEDVVRRARSNSLGAPDYAGTTVTLTNPGTIGTGHSVPRLMTGQSVILGVGALELPAEYAGASDETLADLGISRTVTLTSTYDHRVIQGAQSGEFLRLLHAKLLGEDGFYQRLFTAFRVPYEPVAWVRDIAAADGSDINKTARVVELIHAYRVRGHLMADTDPLEYRQRRHPDLDVQSHGLTLWDLDRTFPTGGFGGKPKMRLRDILGVLRDSYCRTVGVEYMHIADPDQRRWIQDRVEGRPENPPVAEQLRILARLNAAEAFESFLQTKFVGQKRFSLEGGESMIAVLDGILSEAADAGLHEVCIGMAHRGRLNVLANIARKTYRQIFAEFEGQQDPKSVQGSGDVKYHLGTEGVFTAESGATTRVYIAANPSHLEAVDPVLEGIARAKQDRLDMGGETYPVLPVLVHGDAAFAGQGVVAETLNLSQLRGYRTGGSIHVVVNNQVGFTTAPEASRSSHYATDVARMIQAPIFHVNGDDPEACVRMARLAFRFREEFDRDVVIDLVCYRKRGHNEGDDPSMTQPRMYEIIENKRSVRKTYTDALLARGDITSEQAEDTVRQYAEILDTAFAEVREATASTDRGGLEMPRAQARELTAPERAEGAPPVPLEVVHAAGDAYGEPPEGFTVHPKLAPLLARRQEMSRSGGIDWAFAELLAFASLLAEGTPVRLAGQDSRRGTFVQRHAVLTDRVSGEEWTPLLYTRRHLADPGEREFGKFWVYDSLLSEYAAMGFEYGYSVERPDALVLWEAQFGDFVNGAQTIIDEFVCAGSTKWAQRSSVVLLLPHGMEGQGPDHSSARPERFLQLCADDNLTVAYPSTPASYFHLLRRQAHQRPSRPLVVLTPKSMLRLRSAVSGVDELTSGTFRPVLPDPAAPAPEGVDRVLLCSGKIAHDLVAARDQAGDARTAVVRLEQLAPLPVAEVREALAAYPGAEPVWVQEEPVNQGFWTHVAMTLSPRLDRPLRVVSRGASASPATGSSRAHAAEQSALVAEALAR